MVLQTYAEVLMVFGSGVFCLCLSVISRTVCRQNVKLLLNAKHVQEGREAVCICLSVCLSATSADITEMSFKCLRPTISADNYCILCSLATGL